VLAVDVDPLPHSVSGRAAILPAQQQGLLGYVFSDPKSLKVPAIDE
jgi:hypothetical protein